MRVRVLVFAQLVEQVGARELPLDLADTATVGDALDALCAQHGAIASLRDRLAVAVNEAYVRGTHRVCEGDTIALIPPVSGG